VFLYQPHAKTVGQLQFHPHNHCKMYTTSYDGTVRCLDLDKGEFEQIHAVDIDGIATLHHSFIPEGSASNLMYIGDTEGAVSALDLRSLEIVWSHRFSQKKVNTVHANPAAPEYLVTASVDRSVSVWDVRCMGTGKQASTVSLAVASCTSYSNSVNCAYFSPTGKWLVTVDQSDKVCVFNNPASSATNGLVPFKRFNHNNQTGRWLTKFHALWDVKSPDVYLLGSLEKPRRIEVFAADTPYPVALLQNHEHLCSVQSLVVAHPKLNMIAGVNSSGRVHIFR